MIELEVKVLNIDLNEMENKLKSLGAILISEENQINTIFDDKSNYIQNNMDSYLRIREKTNSKNEKSINLTFKKNLKGQELRENLELNVALKDDEDKNNMIEILKFLGYETINIGLKDRKSYELDGMRFDLDIWDKETYPYPYMEIEVKQQEDLEKAIELLEIPRENISTESIVQLKNKIKK